jgi:hypothetical protein
MLEYLLERFLYRVSIHPLGQQHFVLKGGLLLGQAATSRQRTDGTRSGTEKPRRARAADSTPHRYSRRRNDDTEDRPPG